MSKVVTLAGVVLPAEGEVNDEIVADARALLEMAEAGDVRGVFIMAQRNSGVWWNATVGPFDIETMVGHLMRHQVELVRLSSERQPE